MIKAVMSRIAILLCIFAMTTFGANRTWNSSGSMDMNDPNNYTGSGALLATDDLVFDGTSVVNATATAHLSVGSVTVASAYTGNWSIAGRSLTCSGNATYSGPGTLNFGNGMTFNGATSALTINNTVGTVTATNCALQFTGSGQTLAYNSAVAPIFRSLAVADNAGLTTSGTMLTFKGTGTVFSMGNSARLTQNNMVCFASMATATPFSLGSGYTWNGTGGDVHITTGLPDIVITIPEMHYSGNGIFYIKDGYAAASSTTFNFNGPIDLGSLAVLWLYVVGPGNGLTRFNTNGFPITCNSLYTGSNSTEARQFEINYGSSSIVCSGYALGPLNIAGVAQTINLQNSQWTCSGNWTFGSNHTVNPGTSTVTLTGASTVTSNGKYFNDIVINAPSSTVSFASPVSLHSLTTTAGNISLNGTTLTATGNVICNSNGTHNLGNGITMNGNNANLTIAATVGAVTSSSCEITWNGTGGTLLLQQPVFYQTFKSLQLGSSASITSSAFYYVNIMSPSYALIMGAGSSLTLGSGILTLARTTNGDLYNLSTGYTITNNLNFQFRINSGITMNIPAITIGGATGSLCLSDFGIQPGSLIQLTGALHNGNRPLYFGFGNQGGVIDFNDQNVTCGALSYIQYYSTNQYKLGNGVFNITNLSSFGGTEASQLNMEGVTLNCSGNFSIQTNLNLDPGTAQVNITGPSTINSGGKSLPQITLNANTTWVGNSTIVRLKVLPGVTCTFQPAFTYTIQNFSAGDWQGAQGNLARFQSSTAGQQYSIAMPENTVINNYCRFQDLNLTTGQLVANSVSCQDGGNNQGISWVAEGAKHLAVAMTNGSVTLSPPGGTYLSGMNVTLTAIPSSGFSFTGWEGDLSGAQNPKTITITGDMTVTAKSELGDYQPPNTCGADQNLLVSGRILCSEMKIKNWLFRQAAPPDYVFSKTYPLLDLGELELFIRSNNHLPEVPSAKDMQESGLDLTRFNMTLLKKIEELTLYAIEQNQAIEMGNKKMEELKKKIDRLQEKRENK